MSGRYLLKIALGFALLISISIALLLGRHPEVHFMVLGKADSNITWIYLCGLTSNWHDALELENRDKLSRIGKQLGIKFIAIKPYLHCHQFGNVLCWPHDSQVEVLQVYSHILQFFPESQISGFVGFSNGGFFLNKLVQYKQLDMPVVSIGSSGYLENGSYANALYLLVGKQDVYHIEGARQLYKQSKNSELDIQLVEYEDGHVIPEKLLESLISSFIC